MPYLPAPTPQYQARGRKLPKIPLQVLIIRHFSPLKLIFSNRTPR